jgi:hypothetical protein
LWLHTERLVEAGKAPSISAVFNDALQEKVERDRRVRSVWAAAVAKSDPAKGARIAAYVNEQLARL